MSNKRENGSKGTSFNTVVTRVNGVEVKKTVTIIENEGTSTHDGKSWKPNESKSVTEIDL